MLSHNLKLKFMSDGIFMSDIIFLKYFFSTVFYQEWQIFMNFTPFFSYKNTSQTSAFIPLSREFIVLTVSFDRI